MWKRLADFDLEIVNHQAIKINDILYIIGGYKRSVSPEFENISIYVISRAKKCIRLNVEETCVWDCVSGSIKYDEERVNPIDRYGHSVIVWKRMGVLFGGCSSYDYCDSDIYLFTPGKKCSGLIRDFGLINSKQDRWLKVDGIRGSIPKKRDGHSAVLHEHSMFIFGGLVDNESRHYDNKLYQLDLQSWQWTIVHNGDYLEPLGRDFCQLLVHSDCLYLMGGRSDKCYRGYSNSDIYDTAVWKFNLRPRAQEKNWICVHPGYGIICECTIEHNQNNADTTFTKPAISPLPRRSFMAVMLKSEIILFGGLYETGEISVHFNDLWLFNPIQNNWRCLSSNIPKEIVEPAPLRRGTLTLLNNNSALLIGGFTPQSNSSIDTSRIFGKSLQFSYNAKPSDFNFVEGASLITNVSFYNMFHKPFNGSISTINDRSLKSTNQIFLFQRNFSLYQKSLNIVVEKYSLLQLKNYHIPSSVIRDIESTRIFQGSD